MDLDAAATQLLADYDSKNIGTIFNQAQFTIEQAYEIQRRVASLREQRGETVIGYKVGCVSPALRESMGIFHPVFGRLFDSEQWESGVRLDPSQFATPAIEGELAVVLKGDLHTANPSDAALVDAIDCVFVVIEMHNKVFRQSPGAPELIANNAIHAGVIQTQQKASIVPDVPGPLQVFIDDVQVASVSGADLRSTVFDSLRWLTQALKHQNQALRAGQTVLCGTISGMHPIEAGTEVEITTEHFGSVSMRFG
ncbi:MAG: 2-keto-4-pentenoate hydratase [Pseudomonadales bacterium]